MSIELTRTHGFVGDLRIEAIVKRGNGEVERIMQKAHSPLANWGRLVKALFDASSETIILPDGSTSTFDGSLYATDSGWCNGGTPSVTLKRNMRLDAGEGDDSYGFVVGYGTRPVDFWDFNLDAKYPHGTTLSKIYYKASNIMVDYSQTVTIDDKSYHVLAVIVERTFENRANGNQTISETGLIIYVTITNKPSLKFMIFRDVLDTPITLAPTDIVTLRYHLRWLLPA